MFLADAGPTMKDGSANAEFRVFARLYLGSSWRLCSKALVFLLFARISPSPCSWMGLYYGCNCRLWGFIWCPWIYKKSILPLKREGGIWLGILG